MRFKFFNFYVLIFTYYFKFYNCLNTSFECTSNVDELDDDDLYNDNQIRRSKSLNIDCGKDLIYIAWSHYGHQTKFDKDEQNCNFSLNDCIVNVGYVANECNGLSKCQISLDTQYLHSCKAYSDYIFILYDCIDVNKTINICDDNVDIESNDHLYIKTPNYPNEYTNNLNCNCTITTSGNQIQFESFEFDIETSFDSMNNLNNNNLKCNKDYLNINDTKYCGTINSYTNLLNLQKSTVNSLDFQFFSDDSLTRRGFWIKIKSAKYSKICPENFVLIDNICIRIYDNLMTWFESKDYCLSNGYELLTLDNYEINKQLNGFFNENLKLWTGLKHLNNTNWFNENNDVIYFDKLWWPWLELDNSTYGSGSCVGKSKNSLFIEDCYQRLRFACQYKLVHDSSQASSEKVNLKCGKNHKKMINYEIKNGQQQKYSTSSNIQQQQKIEFKSSIEINKSNIIDSNQQHKISFSEDSTKLNDLSSTSVKNKTLLYSDIKLNPDSKLFIVLISSIIILITFVNIAVVGFLCFCRRRKALFDSNNDIQAKTQTMNSDHTSLATSTETDTLAFSYNNTANTTTTTQRQINNNNLINTNSISSSFNIDKNDTRNILIRDPSVHIYETISNSAMYGRMVNNRDDLEALNNNNNNNNTNISMYLKSNDDFYDTNIEFLTTNTNNCNTNINISNNPLTSSNSFFHNNDKFHSSKRYYKEFNNNINNNVDNGNSSYLNQMIPFKYHQTINNTSKFQTNSFINNNNINNNNNSQFMNSFQREFI